MRGRSVPRREFAGLLWRLADLVQAAERRSSFRAKAYRSAIWALDDLRPDLEDDEANLLATPGIGPGIAGLISEYRSTGALRRLEDLERSLPRETPDLRRLPRMNLEMLTELKSVYGVDTAGDLLTLLDTGVATEVSGLGPATATLWEEILGSMPGPGKSPAYSAWVTARSLADHIGAHLDVWVDIAGEVRRVTEWVGRIDLVVLSESETGVRSFLETTAVLAGLDPDGSDRYVGETHSGIGVAIHRSPPEAAGTALLWATGPPKHAASVTSEPFPTEFEAYESVGMAFVPPPARELAPRAAGNVVEITDIRGDLHIHTEASPDGRMGLESILRIASQRGYEYVLVSDHTLGLRFGGLGPEELAAQSEEIERLAPLFPSIHVWHGAELNILADGSLDLDAAGLATLDFAVAGVHSNFRLTREDQTERVLRAMAHPKVRVLAHPLGRRIGIRPPIDIDMREVIDAAIEHGVALETNGHRDRLDLPVEWVRVAVDRGAVLAANSDAHRIGEIDNVANAVATLQRAGVRKRSVVNTMGSDDFRVWVLGGEGGI